MRAVAKVLTIMQESKPNCDTDKYFSKFELKRSGRQKCFYLSFFKLTQGHFNPYIKYFWNRPDLV